MGFSVDGEKPAEDSMAEVFGLREMSIFYSMISDQLLQEMTGKV